MEIQNLIDLLYPPSAPWRHSPEHLIKSGKEKEWAIKLVRHLHYNNKEWIWRHYGLKGSQPLYAYFHNSANWGNGGDTVSSYSNSLSYSKRNANRGFDNWDFNILKQNAEKYNVPFIEICAGVLQVSLVPTDLELASWLSEKFKDFNDFKPAEFAKVVSGKIIVTLKEGGQIEASEEEFLSAFRLGGILT